MDEVTDLLRNYVDPVWLHQATDRQRLFAEFAASMKLNPDPQPLLFKPYLPMNDHCHGDDRPDLGREWYEPIADEL